MGPPEDTKLTLWEEIVDALEALSGTHPGYRRVHAKGTVCEGSFTPTPEAAALSIAPHLQTEVPATIRFSNASGNPKASDANPIAGRGMAVKFHHPDGEASDIVSVPLPVWAVRTAEDFLAFVQARKPDPETGQPDPEKLGAFVAEHPETAKALQLGLPHLAPTQSFATSDANSLHAFGLIDAGGETTWGRYHWSPEEGVQHLSEEEIQAADRDYLQQEIRERLGSGSAAFALEFTKANEGDSLTDPTEVWEGDHEVVQLGRLEVTGVLEDAEKDGVLVFDPMNLCEGIEPSDDEILAARPKAYSVSIERRTASA
jgi:catalase